MISGKTHKLDAVAHLGIDDYVNFVAFFVFRNLAVCEQIL